MINYAIDFYDKEGNVCEHMEINLTNVLYNMDDLMEIARIHLAAAGFAKGVVKRFSITMEDYIENL